VEYLVKSQYHCFKIRLGEILRGQYGDAEILEKDNAEKENAA